MEYVGGDAVQSHACFSALFSFLYASIMGPDQLLFASMGHLLGLAGSLFLGEELPCSNAKWVEAGGGVLHLSEVGLMSRPCRLTFVRTFYGLPKSHENSMLVCL